MFPLPPKTFPDNHDFSRIQIILNQVKSLPHVPSHVTYVDVSWNDLKEIRVPSQILHLNASYNLIRQVHEPLPEYLVHLNLDANYISNLPTLPDTLKHLSVKGNVIKHIPKLPPNLTNLSLSGNPLARCPELPNSLVYLDINTACLTKLPPLPLNLKFLFCAHNFLCSLPNLPYGLTHLYCSSNILCRVPLLPDTIIALDLGYNSRLKTFLPNKQLPSNLEKLYINDTGCEVLPKLPKSLFVLNVINTPRLIYVTSFIKYRQLCPYNLRHLAATKIQRNYIRHYTRRLVAATKIKKALHNYLWKPPHGINIKIGYNLCFKALYS